MIFLVPGVVVLGLILGVYRWRVHRIPWAFLVVTTVVMLQSALIEAFGVQAGAEVGSLSNISLLAVLIYGFLRIRPVWRLGLTGITLVILGIVSLIAYAIAGIYFDDILTRLDEQAFAAPVLGILAITLGIVFARDLPRAPRRVIASPFLLLVFFPLTRIGTALEATGRYMVLAALVLLVVGWIWLGISLLGNRHVPAPA